jgi:hypothetical protein
MKILLVDDRIPDPNFGAGFPRAYRLLLSLRQLGHEIYFFPMLTKTIEELDLDALKAFGVEVWKELEPHKDIPIDVAIMSRPHNIHYHLPKVRQYFPKAKVIYDTEALWFRRYDLQLSITGRLPGWAYRYDELGFCKQVDMCFVVNDIEKKILEENGCNKVVKLGHALSLKKEGSTFKERSNLLVVGGKLEEDSTNEDALWWFMENCWSKLKSKINCSVDATGAVLTQRLQENQFENLNLMGHVSDLATLYQTRKIFVASTRFSTGIPWKVHEAMANGIPCVISRLLATQLAIPDDLMAMVCDTQEDYIRKIELLYTNEKVWNDMREAAFSYMEDECNIPKFKHILQTSLTTICS